MILIIKTKKVFILNKFSYIKIRALRGTIIDMTKAREEVQYALVLRTL